MRCVYMIKHGKRLWWIVNSDFKSGCEEFYLFYLHLIRIIYYCKDEKHPIIVLRIISLRILEHS